MKTATFKVWQGNCDGGELKTYEVEVDQGYVVLDLFGLGYSVILLQWG